MDLHNVDKIAKAVDVHGTTNESEDPEQSPAPKYISELV